MSTAFVLSGGASLGAIQVGMLRALYERGITPDFIIGTSAGALNGAFIASRPQTVNTADDLAGVWRGVRRSEIFPANPMTGLIGFLGRRNYLVADSGLRALLEREIGFERLEDATVPLHVIAVDLYSAKEVRLSSGPAADAVMASAAIPGVFEPVPWDDMDLIDGGVANNTPISHAVELGAEEVYVLPAGRACALEEPPRGALGMSLHAMTLLLQQRLQADIAAVRGRVRLHVLPPPCPLSVQPIDFSRSDELIGRALSDSRGFLSAEEDPRAAERRGSAGRPQRSGAGGPRRLERAA
jgi:NTE family protein